MEQEFEQKLKEYLQKNGVTEIPSDNKKTMQLLKNIIYHSDVDADVAELSYSKLENKTEEDTINYLKKVENLTINYHNGLYYLVNIKEIDKAERRIKRVQKIKSLFKRK